MQAHDSTNCILPEGEVPGLKSEAIATGRPAFIISLTGERGRLRKKAQPGSTVGIVSEPMRLSISSAPICSRWSTDIAPYFTPTCTPPDTAISLACIFGRMPYLMPAIRMRSVSSQVKNPLSQNTSMKSARSSAATKGIISLMTRST